MNYLVFLLQWFNWPYLAAFLIGLISFGRLSAIDRLGKSFARVLGVGRVSGHVIVRVFAFSLGVIGLTFNGALHDYWPQAQEGGFLPGLVLSLGLAAVLTRSIGRLFQRHFPEIKAVGWGSPNLGGREARVVSRVVSPDYRAGRAQVMGDDETLHVVMCKTRESEIPYGAAIVLGEYDAEDGRYYVARVEAREVRSEIEREDEGG